MKAVLLSIRPEWCDLIIRGQKTIEVRRTKPGNLKTPFKCYVYCTKSKSKIGWLLIVPGKDGSGWMAISLASLHAMELKTLSSPIQRIKTNSILSLS